MNTYDDLKWETRSSERVLHTPVFDVYREEKAAPNGMEGNYVAIDAPDWVVIVAVHDGKFILVRQWRHGEGRTTLEFPGGVADVGEAPEQTALRELEEETGYRAQKITFLGRVSSNTALFRNHFSVFLAEDLVQTGQQHLDADELIHYEELPMDEVIHRYGDEELTHAYMGTALAFYLRHTCGQLFEEMKADSSSDGTEGSGTDDKSADAVVATEQEQIMEDGKYYSLEVNGERLGGQVFPVSRWSFPQAWSIAQDYEAELYRITYENGQVVNKELMKR